MKVPMPYAVAGASLAAALTLAARPPAPQQQIAPFVVPERAIYGLELSVPTRDLFPTLRSIDPVNIIGVEGKWALVGFRGLTRGPIWINFDHVISYRTDP
jgi:hypothetical protein